MLCSRIMSSTKEQIETLLVSLNPKKLEIFKTKKENDYSLTQHGYMTITLSKMYSSIFIATLGKEEIQAPSTLISLKKIFESPYFIKGRKVFYFDEILHAEICVYGGLSEYVKHQKTVDKVNH